ncbi:MAG: hypothetical protein P8I99_04450 [Acidimicrobiales bacterium]|nr:hypothetical protein [Acidimicrobiales bacterium]MDG1876653.1 hypothetical protein [Acidimicrobiales bacterium]
MSIDDKRTQRLLSGVAWDDFCDQLKAAGRIVARETAGGDPQDAVEGYRYLTRMILMGNMRAIERRTPGTKPRFIGLIPPPIKGGIGVQSPNQDHIVQPVDSRYRYRITGTVGDVYTHLSAWSPPIPGDVGAFSVGLDAETHLETFNPNMALTPHTLVLSDMAAADGTVDFVLSVEPPGDGSAWMSMASTTRELMGRVVWDDRNEQTPPRLVIECLDDHDQPEPPSPSEMAERLAVAGQLVLGQKSDYEGWTADLLTRENQTEFTREWYERIGGSPDDRHFEFGYWRVPAGKALVVEFDEPEAQHWNFQLCNHWMENLANYATGEGYVDCENVVRDGSHVRIVVAHNDPGVPNWVQPATHDHGVMGIRFVQPATEPQVKCRLVVLADLT